MHASLIIRQLDKTKHEEIFKILQRLCFDRNDIRVIVHLFRTKLQPSNLTVNRANRNTAIKPDNEQSE